MTLAPWIERNQRASVPARSRRRLHIAPWSLEEATERAVEEVSAVTARHVHGTLGAIVREHLATGGKRTRILLALRCAQAVDVPLRDAVPLAVAAELLHNATLIHDDLQDGDAVRRGEPTVWARHGVAQAINAGDVLLMLPFLAIADSVDGAARASLTAMVARRAAATACGQSEELSLLADGRVDWASYSGAARGKTGQIFAIPFEGAALLAGALPADAVAVGDLATWLGLAYQTADDLLDLYGDKGRGEAGNDLREGKVSAVIATHLERKPDDHAALLELLRLPREETSTAAVASWSRRFFESGAAAEALARAHSESARIDATPLPESLRPLRAVMSHLRADVLGRAVLPEVR